VNHFALQLTRPAIISTVPAAGSTNEVITVSKHFVVAAGPYFDPVLALSASPNPSFSANQPTNDLSSGWKALSENESDSKERQKTVINIEATLMS